MIDDAFKKERENIRAKMLKYSRAINKGESTDEILADDESAKPSKSDDVIKKRLEKDKKATRGVFGEEKREKFALKKDLIDVKLEEKTSLAKRLFAKLKKKKVAPKTSNTKPSTNLKAESKQNSNLNAPPSKPNLTPNALKAQSGSNSQSVAKRNLEDINLNNLKAQSATKSNPQTNSQENFKKPNSSLLKSAKAQENAKTQNEKIHAKPANLASHSTPLKENLPIRRENSAPHSPNLAQIRQNSQNQSKIVDEDSIKAKNALLQGHSKATQDEKNLGKNQLLFATLCIVFAVVVFVPKIYITSNIYYLSRDIAALRTQESVLSEENKELNKKLENMRFQNQILDYLE